MIEQQDLTYPDIFNCLHKDKIKKEILDIFPNYKNYKNNKDNKDFIEMPDLKESELQILLLCYMLFDYFCMMFELNITPPKIVYQSFYDNIKRLPIITQQNFINLKKRVLEEQENYDYQLAEKLVEKFPHLPEEFFVWLQELNI